MNAHPEAVIGRKTAVGLTAAFALLVAFPAAHQLVRDLGRTGRWSALRLFRQAPTHASLKEFENALARDSELGTLARTAYQTLLARALREGNDKVLVGRDGFLFFRKEVEMAAGPGFLSRRAGPRRGSDDGERTLSDPVGAIADYHRQLKARGIRLVFVPIPAKPFIYPERVWPGTPGPAWNRDRDLFRSKLAQAGVDVLDVTDELWRAKETGEVFLRSDTHWTPLGLGAAADRIADHLRPMLSGTGTGVLPSRSVPVTNGGDLLRMMDLWPGASPFKPETVEPTQVTAPAGDDAPVLLLGDSFTNIYSRKELEWGEGAGLAEQLALLLGRPVQALALNGGGATAVRQLLSRKPALLARKRVVLWACSARDLFDESVAWELVPLP
jgi:alginate O-acetyltransferase complex protein AlgJ